jgi:ribosomal protein L29
MAAGLTAPELRELSADELAARLREHKEELFNLRFQVATGQLDNNRRLPPGSTRSCASASWVSRSPRTRVWHERDPGS